MMTPRTKQFLTVCIREVINTTYISDSYLTFKTKYNIEEAAKKAQLNIANLTLDLIIELTEQFVTEHKLKSTNVELKVLKDLHAQLMAKTSIALS